MAKFPADAPKKRVIKALQKLGFRLVREQEHISMVRDNANGTQTPLTMPNHRLIKGSTLRATATYFPIRSGGLLQKLFDGWMIDINQGDKIGRIGVADFLQHHLDQPETAEAFEKRLISGVKSALGEALRVVLGPAGIVARRAAGAACLGGTEDVSPNRPGTRTLRSPA
jgi:hypothetical protein